ncbi:glycosyltransferase family 1 protein [Limosilactobacillus galli]|uniref:glycosyltransferase family 1 protein n=1 Tax=Limosilactobacillus galli TaxID=2991834 RepID=UPI0024BA387F|nr:glycosyltransferase family 1 protein [Limosilactobacillus galli]
MKTKILHVQLTKNFGGIESLLTNVYANIDRTKYQFDFIATAKEPYQEKLKRLGGRIYLAPSIKHLVPYVKFFNHILDNNYDVVHFHKNSAANVIPILLTKYHPSHPKIIVHSHNTSPSVNNVGLMFLHKLNRSILIKIADKEVACANVAAKWMFGTSKDVQIINNGIDIDKFTFSSAARESIRRKLNIPFNDLVLGNVGRFSEQKNQSFLIDIFKEVEKENPNSRLILVGDGHLLKNIKEKVNSLGLGSKVIFTGKEKNIPDYLSAMDIFVMPSLYEGLPISAVEAQAEGLGVYLSDAISKEVVLTNNTKMFSLNDEPNVIARQLLNYIKSNNREDGAKTVKEYYSLEKTVKDFTNLYQGILQ